MILSLPDPANLRSLFSTQGFVTISGALRPMELRRWRNQAARLESIARQISRHDDAFHLVYKVLTGEELEDLWPELFDLYHCPDLHSWIKAVTGEAAIFTSQDLRSGLNLNIMQGTDSVYRWHFDAIPYTALLYLTHVQPSNGGGLEVIVCREPGEVPNVIDSDTIQIWPKAGTMILMDGTRCYHRVAQLRQSSMRLSIPMVFPATTAKRPSGLDTYLYDAAA